MPQTIQRTNNLPGYPATCGTVVANSTTISMSGASAMSFLVSAPQAAVTRISWLGALSPDGPYVPIFLSGEEQAYTDIFSSGQYVSPPELFACAFVRGVSDLQPVDITVLLKG